MMSIFDFFRAKAQAQPSTASIAKERLQIIVQHQRGNQENVDFMPKLQQELLEVISRYVNVDPNLVKVALERSDERSVLELNITLPG
jgi:cell division topological specificity factor